MKKNPPPSTPTPRRFLLAKRAATQAAQTPAPHPQFQSTPRFGSSSVPRPTQRRDVGVEDVDDEDDDEDDEDESDAAGHNTGPHWEGRHLRTQDSIEVESDGASASQSEEGPTDGHDAAPREADALDEEQHMMLNAHQPPSPEVRQVKRRRVSISPDPESPIQRSTSPLARHHADDASASTDSLDSSQQTHDAPEGLDSADTERAAAEDAGLGIKHAQQPVFRPAPRFKPADAALEAEGLLPAAFSPQRRGARYVPGGLAAELQGWLSEVKGWEGTDTVTAAASTSHTTMRVVVEEVRPGQNMHLVRARSDEDDLAKNYILAGQGKLTGLGRQADVEVGSVVVIGPPVWETELDGCVWTVACDWTIG